MGSKEALRINEWTDVERLERDVMSFEKDGSFLQKAFLINKDKLSRIIDKIAKKGGPQESFNTGPSLQPGGSIAFPFTIKAPHLFGAKKGDFQFKVSYKNSGNDKITVQSVGCKATLNASPFAVPTGGMLGAICGYLVKFTVAAPSPEILNITWIGLGGSLLLGLVSSIVLSRKPEVNKAITVEDFVGGFAIGALAGLFSEQIILKLGLLVK